MGLRVCLHPAIRFSFPGDLVSIPQTSSTQLSEGRAGQGTGFED
jgi:hypothetical protein